MKRIDEILSNPLFLSTLKQIGTYESERYFCKHDIEHLLSVARIMLIQSYEEAIAIDKDIIYATALLHDIGRALQYEKGIPHAEAGIDIVHNILEQCYYTEKERKTISLAILNHNDKEETSKLSQLLKYADQVSRNCFCCKAYEACNWPQEKKNKGVVI